jgi:hypothetical protein
MAAAADGSASSSGAGCGDAAARAAAAAGGPICIEAFEEEAYLDACLRKSAPARPPKSAASSFRSNHTN